MKIAPFTIDVSSAAVADLARRLEMTRWPDEVGEGGWEYGMPCRVLRDVVDHWRDRFDWRAAERRLCGIGSCGVPRPSLGGYVTRMGPTDGATAAGGHGPQENPVQFPDSHSIPTSIPSEFPRIDVSGRTLGTR